MIAVKALACELPHEHKLPLSRLSLPEIGREAVRRGLVASIGDTTLWHWLREEAIRPWSHRSWIFVRDPRVPAHGRVGVLRGVGRSSREDPWTRRALRRQAARAVADDHRRPHASACELAQSGGDLLLGPARKALTPSDFASLGELEERLFAFGERYEQVANPFEWKFTRRDLHRLLRKLREREHPLAAAA